MKHFIPSSTTRHWLALCALALCALSLPAHAARLAVVIGNDQYEHHSKLRKAGNDADAMAALLKRSGFTVVNESVRRDLSRAQMNQVFSQLVQKVRRDDEVVVFYSGHGLQYGDSSVITGKDFPKPFDRTLALSEGIQLKGWQETIRRAGARFALFVLDACRQDLTEDGLVKSMTGEDALFRTMEPTNPPEGQMVIFSARSGQLSLDRLSNADTNPNGVFTRVFLEEAQKPGVSILDVLGETEERVAQLAATVEDRRTGQPHRQKPALRNEAGQRVKFCFVPNNGQCGEPGPIPRVAVDAEQEAWDLAKRSHSAGGYQAYASAYPQGRYAQAAQVALAGLRPVVRDVVVDSPQPFRPTALGLWPRYTGQYQQFWVDGEVAQFRALFGETVEQPSNLTKVGLIEAFGKMAKAPCSDSSSSAKVVLFSGHGLRKDESSDYFLVASDLEMVSFSDVVKVLGQSSCRYIFIVDALPPRTAQMIASNILMIWADKLGGEAYASADGSPVLKTLMSVLQDEKSNWTKSKLEQAVKAEFRPIAGSGRSQSQRPWIQGDWGASAFSFPILRR